MIDYAHVAAAILAAVLLIAAAGIITLAWVVVRQHKVISRLLDRLVDNATTQQRKAQKLQVKAIEAEVERLRGGNGHVAPEDMSEELSGIIGGPVR